MAEADSVRVVARIRPDSRSAPGAEPCVRKSADGSTVIQAKTRESYAFSSVLGPESTQEEAYSVICGGKSSFVNEALNGFNATVMAYGQTGSGKTHTMMGEEEDGIIPRLAKDLFAGLEQLIREKRANDEDITITVKVSFVEIYRERLRDLLNLMNNKPLRIREGDKRVTVENLSEEFVCSYQELLDVMRRGNSARSVAATRMNEDSSRSHSVFTMKIEQIDGDLGQTITSKIQLVDLAGSEQIKRTGAAGDRLEEAKAINLSLSCLGNVVSALVEKRQFVPYRDSKLTRLLQDSLGGTAKTCLVVTLSPSGLDENETISTLRFGQRAQKVQNQVVKNVKRTVDELERLLAKAEEELATLRAGRSPSPQQQPQFVEELQHRCEDLEGLLERTRIELDEANKARGALDELRLELELTAEGASTRERRALADLDMARQELEEIKARQSNQGQSIAAASMLNSRFEDDVTHLTDKCVRLQMQLIEKDEEIDFLKTAKTDQVWVSLCEKEEQVKDAQQENERLKSELAIARMQIRNREEHIETIQVSQAKVQKSLLQEIANLQAKLKSVEDENRKYKQVLEGREKKSRVIRPVLGGRNSRGSPNQSSLLSSQPRTPVSMSSLSPSHSPAKRGISPIPRAHTPTTTTTMRSSATDQDQSTTGFESILDVSQDKAAHPSQLNTSTMIEMSINGGDEASRAVQFDAEDGADGVKEENTDGEDDDDPQTQTNVASNEGKQEAVVSDYLAGANPSHVSLESSHSEALQLVPFSLSPSRTDLNKLKQMPVREFYFGSMPRIEVEQRWRDDGKGGTELGFGAAVYPAAVALAFTLALQRHTSINGKRIVELGCGVGLVSLAASRWAGASYVIATDGDSATVELCQGNFDRNHVGKDKGACQKLMWGELCDWDELEAKSGGPIEVVLASDVVAVPYKGALASLVGTLVSFRDRARSQQVAFEILLGYSPRNACEEEFFDMMHDEGFEVRRLGKEEIHPDFVSEQGTCQLFSMI